MTESQEPDAPEISELPSADGGTIAYRATEGKTPGVMFLGGFMSDMTGTKALALEQHCRETGRAFVRFDYRGHGESSGEFRDGTIGAWKDDALAVLENATRGPQILIGSSMGGWIMLLLALAHPTRVAGLIGIAAAPDFTERLLLEKLPDEAVAALDQTGVWEQPSEYSDEPYIITKTLIDEGRDHLVLDGPIDIDAPVRLLHGMQDADVPWYYAQAIQDRLASDNAIAILIKDGDHRLSRDSDLKRLCDELDALCETLS